MLYMYAEDNEGKEYKKKIERIYKMKKKFQRVLKGGDSYNNIKGVVVKLSSFLFANKNNGITNSQNKQRKQLKSNKIYQTMMK